MLVQCSYQLSHEATQMLIAQFVQLKEIEEMILTLAGQSQRLSHIIVIIMLINLLSESGIKIFASKA